MKNNKIKTSFLCSLILFGTSLSINAQEKWEGFYAGVDLGYVKGDDKGKEYSLNGTWNLWEQHTKPEGFSLGLLGGHNWMLTDKVLVGLEAAYKKFDASDKVYQNEVPNAETPTGDVCTECKFTTKVDQSFSLLGKVGYLINDKLLGYGIAGYSTVRIKRTVWDGWNQFDTMHYNKWQDGWTLGAGVEYQIMESVSAKLEYKYTDLGRYKYYTPAFEGNIEKQKYDHDEINIGLNYHF